MRSTAECRRMISREPNNGSERASMLEIHPLAVKPNPERIPATNRWNAAPLPAMHALHLSEIVVGRLSQMEAMYIFPISSPSNSGKLFLPRPL